MRRRTTRRGEKQTPNQRHSPATVSDEGAPLIPSEDYREALEWWRYQAKKLDIVAATEVKHGCVAGCISECRQTGVCLRNVLCGVAHCGGLCNCTDGCFNNICWCSAEGEFKNVWEGKPDAPLEWPGKIGQFNFPEKDLEVLKGKLDLGVCFSGGGSRSFVASAGQTIALRSIKKDGRSFMDSVKYIVGISGGAWFSSSYCFYDEKRNGGQSVDDWLGPVTNDPSKLTMEYLSKTPESAQARISPTNGDPYATLDDFGMTCSGNYYNFCSRSKSAFNEARNGVWEWGFIGPIYHEPIGIMPDMYPVCKENLDKEGVYPFTEEDKRRAIVQQRGGFWIGGFSVNGPTDFALFQSPPMFSLYEGTPLHVGSPTRYWRWYHKYKQEKSVMIGGATTPQNFGMLSDDRDQSLASCWDNIFNCCGTCRLDAGHDWTLTKMVGASSLAPGAGLVVNINPFDDDYNQRCCQGDGPWFGNRTAMRERIRFPRTVSDVFITDGGCTDNLGLIPLVQRNVKNIVAFLNTPIPLPQGGPEDGEHMDMVLLSYFLTPENIEEWIKKSGQPPDVVADIGYTGAMYYVNKIFDMAGLNPTCTGLHKNAAEGKPFYQGTYTTTANPYWNIPEGQKHNIIWFYLTPVEQFMNNLPAETRKVIESRNDDRITHLFPNYSTSSQLAQTQEEANILANYTQWLIMQSADLFQNFLDAAVEEKAKAGHADG